MIVQVELRDGAVLHYDAPDTARVGDRVVLPAFSGLPDDAGHERGVIVALGRDGYNGRCRPVLRVEAVISDQRLAELRELAGTPREVTTGDHAAAQSALASAVPELLAEIDRLRSQLDEPGP
jgi:hypothetical protein